MEKTAACPLPPVPDPEEDIAARVCVVDGDEYACIPARGVWVLDRWLSAWSRWAELAKACPGVYETPSGVSEELGKLQE